MVQKRFVVFAAKSSGFIVVTVGHQYTKRSTQTMKKKGLALGPTWGILIKKRPCFLDPGCSGFVRYISRVGLQGQFRPI